MKADMIVPQQQHPNGPEKLDQLLAEYNAHLARAQELYERAMEADVTGDSGRDLLLRQAMIEQNAALLCQGELNRAGVGLIITMLHDLLGIEARAMPRKVAGGMMQ